MIGDDGDSDREDMTEAFGDPLGQFAARDPGAFEAAKKAGQKAKPKRELAPPFAMIPLEFAAAAGDPFLMTAALCIHLDYKSVGEPFDTPKKIFEEWGVSSVQKCRALKELERLGLVVTIERRSDLRGNLVTIAERWRPLLKYKRKYRPARRFHIRNVALPD